MLVSCTTSSVPRNLFLFLVFFSFMCCLPACLLIRVPSFVTLNRFAAACSANESRQLRMSNSLMHGLLLKSKTRCVWVDLKLQAS